MECGDCHTLKNGDPRPEPSACQASRHKCR